MKYYGEQDVVCPFYVGENKQNIFCEGLTDCMEQVCKFNTPGHKRSYQLKYCKSFDYCKCEYAKLLELIKYQEENDMKKTTQEKLESATKLIKELKIEQQAFERERNALVHQIQWRQNALDQEKARTASTELLTKYLAFELAGKDEIRVKIEDLAKYQSNYDVIVVQDKASQEIVITLFDKEKQEFMNDNYKDYQKAVATKIKQCGHGNLYGDYIVVGKQDGQEENFIAIKNAKKELEKRKNSIVFPEKIKARLHHSFEVFDKHSGSMIVAWFAEKK